MAGWSKCKLTCGVIQVHFYADNCSSQKGRILFRLDRGGGGENQVKQLVLGLDLGPNSIGWALIRDDMDSPDKSELVDMGVRVFPEGVDAFDTAKEKSRNEDRRIARGMRRQVRRRVARRKKLIAALIESGLWPEDEASQAELYQLNPYELRERGLREPLTPHEVGRVLLHLNQRRGFLSNRKRDREDSEAKGMLAEINDNERERQEGGFATIGAYLAHKHAALDHTRRTENDHVRHRHLSREQYDAEFEALWDAQQVHHPKLLTPQLRYGTFGKTPDRKVAIAARKPIPKHDKRRKRASDLESFGLHGLIFFQRRMYWPKSVVGLCELEPKQKRCPRADRHAERFRVLQEINNLRYADPDTNEEHPLDGEQRALLVDLLSTRDRVTFDQVRRKLNFLDSVKFNLERGKRSGLKGMTLDHLMAKHAGQSWHARPEAEKDAIVELLRDNEREDDAVVARLISDFGFSAEEAESAIDADFPPGYGNLSRMAIDKLLPHLEAGMIYQSVSDPQQSALHAAGYLRRDELQRRLFDRLPDLRRTKLADCKLGDIPNPVVKRALVELRKVVNAIIREYGKPDAVHVEMARSLQKGAKARKEEGSRMREREALRTKAADEIRNLGIKVRREGILRHLLWEEQNCECIYCGKPISQQQLFGGEIDIDHILPYSRCLDDSQMNKVVCHRMCNHGKGQQTPYEWKGDRDPAAYERICQQAGSLMRKGSMPYAKYRRFLQKEIELDKFIARQLTDTGYITRATVEYVRLLFEKEHAVLGLKGSLTAELRWQWGLDTILSELPDSPAWSVQNDLRAGEKNRADHRHHAIDAVVVALTNRKRLHKLSELVRKGGAKAHGEILPDPWPDFRDHVVQCVKEINVSHRVERGVRGALHEETLYGPTANPEEWVSRKPVETLSAAEIDRIRDEGIKRIVIKALKDAGLEFGRGKKPDAKKVKAALSNLRMPSGVPIKKVRLVKAEKTIAPLRENGHPDQAYVKPGSLHHLCIFEWEEKGKTKRDAVFVTMLEAKKRLKAKGAVIQREAPVDHERVPPSARFVMSLSSREMVLADWKGDQKLLTFKTAASTQGQIYFAEHTDARRSSDQTKFVATANSLVAKKITVDPLGRTRWAND